jgi:hypothetical protein
MNPRDAAKEAIGAFDSANLVALGERHWAREDSQFRLKLIRDPAFAQAVDDIVVEFANPLHQHLLDDFVNGAAVPPAEVAKIWRDTTQPGAWDSPVYEEFLSAVRQVNSGLERGRRLRVLAGDSPIDWNGPSQPRFEDIEERDRYAAATIEREVLNRDRKALVLFGALHLCRKRSRTLVELLRNPKARWFVILPVDGTGVSNPLGAEQASPANPVLIRLVDSPVGGLKANDLFAKGAKRVKVVDGKPVLVPAQLFDPDVELRDVADGCLYFGGDPPELVAPPEGIYAGTEYGKEVQRRRAILWSLLPRTS